MQDTRSLRRSRAERAEAVHPTPESQHTQRSPYGNTERLQALTVLRSARGPSAPEAAALPALSGGEPLESRLRAQMEAAFGHDFGHVRIHRDGVSAQAAAALDAAAMALGSHLFFAAGEWAPHTAAGERLIAHELAHVVQYDEGRVPAAQGVASERHPLEGDAEAQARSALRQMETVLPAAPTTLSAPRAPAAPTALCDRYPHTPDALDSYAARLTALGIRGIDRAALAPLTGDPHDDSLTPAEIETAFIALREAGTGVARGWNGNQDDLGPRANNNDRDHAYWTPLHYGLELHRLATAPSSGGSGYGDYARNHAARMQLAGAPMHVHPRSVWFVAAAQRGMDRAAGIEEGHYAAPAALSNALRPVRRALEGVYTSRAQRFPDTERGRAASARHDRELVERYRSAHADLEEIESLARMHRERDRAADAAGEGREEPEAFAEWLLDPSRQAQIRAIAAPVDASSARAAARALSAATEGAPGRDHGMGAMDGHGTDHAMGLAIDYGTSSSSGAENRGVPAIAWRFLYRLMDESGGPLTGLRPHAIAELPHELRSDLSDLVRGRAGHALHARLMGEAGSPSPAASPAERRALNHAIAVAIQHTNAALRDVRDRLSRVRVGGEELRAEIAAMRDRIWRDLRTTSSQSPDSLSALLARYREDLEALDARIAEAYTADGADERGWLENRMTGAEAGPAPRGVRPRYRRGMSTSERLDADTAAVAAALARIDAARASVSVDGRTDAAAREVDALPEGGQAQWEHERDARLREEVRRPEFRSWWRSASVSGIYSQPDAYVAGIESVHAHPDGRTHFEGGHHWDIAPRAIITNDAAYRDALDRDMNGRGASEIDSIVAILDETASGRSALDTDALLRSELDEHAPGWASRREGASNRGSSPPGR